MAYAQTTRFSVSRLIIQSKSLVELINAIRSWTDKLVAELNQEFQAIQSTGPISHAQVMSRISLRV